MIALDVETFPIGVGQQLTKVVCVNYGLPNGDFGVLRRCDALPLIEQALATDLIVNHFVDFDMGCIAFTWPHLLPAIIAAYEQKRIWCTARWAQLVDYAIGVNHHQYSLADCCKRRGIEHADKENPWRSRFGELDCIPLSAWPQEALQYCLLDGKSTIELACKLPETADIAEQSMYYFWLRLSSAFGLLTDSDRVTQWEAEKRATHERLAKDFLVRGWVRWDKKDEKYKRNMWVVQDAVNAAYSGNPPMTEGRYDKKLGRKVPVPKCDSDTCLETNDSVLHSYAEFLNVQSCLTRELKFLKQPIIHTRYDLAETGRSTSSAPNIQNFSRDSGSRLCVRPRPGFVYAICDFKMLELCCLAQLCVVMGAGDDMAKAIRAGIDLHQKMSARILGVSYDDIPMHPEKKQTRLASKACNFGFPGGSGAESWVQYARASYGVRVELSKAKWIRKLWRNENPDVVRYQKIVDTWISGQCRTCNKPVSENVCALCGSPAEQGVLDHYHSGLRRGGLTYTQACNTLFQGFGGLVAKETGWRLTKAGYAIAAFPHDEYLIELDKHTAVEQCRDISRIATEVCQELLPHAPSSIEPTLSTRWVKDDPVYDDRGILQVIDHG